MIASTATIRTEHASKYLQQMCKHFAHKVKTDYDAHRGQVDFPYGPCTMTAADGALSLRCAADDETAIRIIHGIIESHLVKFAWREELRIQWETRAEAAGGEEGGHA